MASNVVSTGRIELIDLNDSKQLQMFIGNSQPKTQIYDVDNNSLIPDWTVDKPVLTPQLYIAGTSVDIINNAKSINWYEDSDVMAIENQASYTLGSGNKSLTINRNILATTLNFDGIDDYVEIDGNITLSKDASTFEGWFYINNFDPIDNRANAVMIGAVDGAISYNFIGVKNGNVYGETGVNQESFSFSSSNIKAKTWFHLSLVFDTTVLKVYVNGELIGEKSGITADMNIGAFGKTMGSSDYESGYPSWFDGQMSNICIWNVARSELQIGTSMNQIVGNESGIVGYWKFNDGQGEQVFDFSGNGKSGTIYGNANWNNNSSKLIFCEAVYTDQNTGFDVTARANVELSKVLTGSKGINGDVGDSAIMTILDNEFHSVPTDNNGNNGIYSGATTTMTVFVGINDDSANWNYSAESSNGITGSLSGRTYTVSDMTVDNGYVDITASKTVDVGSGAYAFTKRFNLVKDKQGITGEGGINATSYWLVSDTVAVKKDSAGELTPSSIVINAKSKTGTSSVNNYSAKFVIDESTDGSSFTNKYTTSTTETSKTYTPSSTAKIIRVKMYLSDGTTLIDEQTIPIASDGVAGVGGYNSNNLIVWTPNGNMIKNGKGVINAQADMYDGIDIIDAHNYRWYRQNPSESDAGDGWEALDNGKRNYLKNSDFSQDGSYFTINGGGDTEFIDGAFRGHRAIKRTVTGATANGWRGFMGNESNQMEVVEGEEITVSVWSYVHELADQGLRIEIEYFPETGGRLGVNSTNIENVVGEWKYTYRTQIIPNNFSEPVKYARFRVYVVQNGIVSYALPKIERGSVTKWLLAPEEIDIDSEDTNMYGRNLLLNSEFNGFNDWYYGDWSISTTETYLGVDIVEVDRTSLAVSTTSYTDLKQYISYPDKIELNTPYTISFYIRVTANSSSPFKWYLTNITGTSTDNNWTPVTATTDWVKVSRTITFTDKQNANTPMMFFRCFDGHKVAITQPKFEKLKYHTDWTPAPEDNSTHYPTVANGVDSWIFQKYKDGLTSGVVYYDNLKELTPSVKTLILDSTDLVKHIENSYIGYLKTAVYVSQDKSISVTFNHDDNVNVYINGVSVYVGSFYGTTNNLSLELKSGWNTMEFLWYEGSGGDGIYGIIPTIRSLVEEMNCHYALDYGALRGVDDILGYNTSNITIPATAVVNLEGFKCLVEYNTKINFFDKTVANIGQYIKDTDGTMAISQASHSASDYIEILPSTSYQGEGIRTNPTSNGVGLAFYDENKVYISGINYAGGEYLGSFTTPSNAKYLRFSFMDNEIDGVVLEGDSFKPYEDVCIVNDVSDPFNIVILGANTFKNGQGQSVFTAKLFRDGMEIDIDNSDGLIYKWHIYNSDDSLNTSFSKTGKTITVSADDINNEGRLVCEVGV